MSECYVGEIRAFGFSFAPRGWAQCNGQLMPISQNPTLYAIIGTIYGGDGQTTFGLPNLQGRIPMHWGTGPSGMTTVIGEAQGQTTVTLLTTELPQHNHGIVAMLVPSGGGAQRTPRASDTAYLSSSSAPDFVWQKDPATPDQPFSPRALTPAGNSLPHDNMQPYLAMNFCIATEGIFPSRN